MHFLQVLQTLDIHLFSDTRNLFQINFTKQTHDHELFIPADDHQEFRNFPTSFFNKKFHVFVVGSNRHQWTKRELDVAEGIRMMLPERYRRNPLDPARELALRPFPLSVEELMRRDPTEAADSENIVPAIRECFPDADIVLTGGVIYHLALNDVIANFTEDDDLPLLNSLLAIDEALAREGLTQYATAIASR